MNRRPGRVRVSPHARPAFLVSPRARKAVAAALGRWRSVSRRWRFTAIASLFGAAVAAGILALTLGGPPPRARQYLDFKACLLTDAKGIAGRPASPIWAGMGRASLRSHARIQYLPAFGPDTVPNALPYLASLVQRRCDVIVAAGPTPASAVSRSAARYPRIRFIAVGSAGTARNLTSVNPSDPTAPDTVQRLIIDAVHKGA